MNQAHLVVWIDLPRCIGDVEARALDGNSAFGLWRRGALKREVWLKRILETGAVLETGVGLVLLSAPSDASSFLLRAPLVGAGMAVGRLAGGALIGLGIACFGARGTPCTPAGLGISRGFLAYNVVACAILVLNQPPLPSGLIALAASVGHGVLAVALTAVLFAEQPKRG